MKKKSVSNLRGTLHACLEAAVEDGILRTNPAHFRSKSKLMRLGTTTGERRAKVKAFDLEQAVAFFAAAPTSAPRHWMKWRTMVSTGLRPGEAAGLKPEDLDYGKGRIRVARAITRGKVEACKTTAQGEFEDVDMPAGLADELRAWETATAAHALYCGQSREWLFQSSRGTPLEEQEERNAFKRTLKAAGLPGHFTPHSLRHTYATQQLVDGVSIYYVQRQMRHATINMTVGTYGSWLPAGDRTVADRHFERLFGGMSEPRQKPQSKRSR